MPRSLRHVLPLALICLAASVATLRADSATLAAIGLPSSKASIQELKYAFGKDWEAAIRSEVKDDLAATKLFTDIVPENGDVTLLLEVREIKRDFRDLVKVSSKAVLTFTATGHYWWTRGSGDAVAPSAVSEGSFAVEHVINLDRAPFRADLSAGWREILRKAVVEAAQGSEAQPAASR